jgi:hypothetical protein
MASGLYLTILTAAEAAKHVLLEKQVKHLSISSAQPLTSSDAMKLSSSFMARRRLLPDSLSSPRAMATAAAEGASAAAAAAGTGLLFTAGIACANSLRCRTMLRLPADSPGWACFGG